MTHNKWDYRNIISDYIMYGLDSAEYSILEDNSICGTIPDCLGVIAFGKTLSETQAQLKSVFEGWILLGLRMGHKLPVLNDINLNIEAELESMDTL
jgi:predicted RNase H-like HicB family nuclease